MTNRISEPRAFEIVNFQNPLIADTADIWLKKYFLFMFIVMTDLTRKKSKLLVKVFSM